MSGVIQKAYHPQVMAAGASFTLPMGARFIGGFLASVAGTINIVNENQQPILTAYPVAAGFNEIPLVVGPFAVISLTTAAGTLLVM